MWYTRKSVLVAIAVLAFLLMLLIWILASASAPKVASLDELRIPPILRYSKDWVGRG